MVREALVWGKYQAPDRRIIIGEKDKKICICLA